MKKIILLLVVLAALVGVAFFTKDSSEKRLKPVASREKLIPDLDVNAVRKIRIKEGDTTATLAFTADTWAVAERSNYPAAFEKIGNLLVELKDQKAGKQRTLGKNAWGDVKLKMPGDGKADETGLQVELLGEGDKSISTLVLGKNVNSSTVGKEASPFGGGGSERYVRVANDTDAVWVVENQFYELQPKAEDWIDKSFIDVQKIKEVQVTAPKAEDSWKVARKEEVGEFLLTDAKQGDEFDNAKASLSSLLSNATFSDVVPKDKVGGDFLKDAYAVKITTFDNFVYDFKMLKKGEGSDEKHYMTVAVSANLPKERAPVKDEKPEDKKKADEDFAATKKTQEEKLAKEKKHEGWVYEVSSYVISNVMKKRSETLKDKPAPEAKPAAAPAPAPAAPATPPVSVTTPPVAVPPAPAAAPAPAKAADSSATPATPPAKPAEDTKK